MSYNITKSLKISKLTAKAEDFETSNIKNLSDFRVSDV
nr:MAG TPA: hypothetical protein [Caudoviricetes sp.]